jgi:hypothetical protein
MTKGMRFKMHTYLLASLLDLREQVVVCDRALHEHLLLLEADVEGRDLAVLCESRNSK